MVERKQQKRGLINIFLPLQSDSEETKMPGSGMSARVNILENGKGNGNLSFRKCK